MCKYVVVDLEMCKVAKNRRTESFKLGTEIIQVGATLLDEKYEVLDTFNRYVAPAYGQIDTFIHHLTGIGKIDVKNAQDVEKVFQEFMDWLPEGEVRAVSWSRTDEKQIRNELAATQISIKGMDELLDTWIDCQKTFGEKMNSRRSYKLSEALIAADIISEGQEHDGLSDAYNTALLFAKMEGEEVLQLNPVYAEAIAEEQESLKFTLGDLFQGLQLSDDICA